MHMNLFRLGVIRSVDNPPESSGSSEEPTDTTENTSDVFLNKITEIMVAVSSVAQNLESVRNDLNTLVDAQTADNTDTSAVVDSDDDGDADTIVTPDGEIIDKAVLSADIDDLDFDLD